MPRIDQVGEVRNSFKGSSLGSTTSSCWVTTWCVDQTSPSQPAAKTQGRSIAVENQPAKDLVIRRQDTLPFPGYLKAFIAFVADANLFITAHYCVLV